MDSREERVLLGTIHYMSPEQAEEKKELIGIPSDLFRWERFFMKC